MRDELRSHRQDRRRDRDRGLGVRTVVLRVDGRVAGRRHAADNLDRFRNAWRGHGILDGVQQTGGTRRSAQRRVGFPVGHGHRDILPERERGPAESGRPSQTHARADRLSSLIADLGSPVSGCRFGPEHAVGRRPPEVTDSHRPTAVTQDRAGSGSVAAPPARRHQ
jgi:hypothetical protein